MTDTPNKQQQDRAVSALRPLFAQLEAAQARVEQAHDSITRRLHDMGTYQCQIRTLKGCMTSSRIAWHDETVLQPRYVLRARLHLKMLRVKWNAANRLYLSERPLLDRWRRRRDSLYAKILTAIGALSDEDSQLI